MMNDFIIYLLTAAGVTYLIRMLPLVLVKKKIKSRFILSFLHYIPYTVLSVMTIPAIFYSSSYTISAVIGFCAAMIAGYFEQSLVKVAGIACTAVLVTESVLGIVI